MPRPGFDRIGSLQIAAVGKVIRDDLLWAAGFLEGEGNFNHSSNSDSVRAAQVNEECLQRLLLMFGGRIMALDRGRTACPVWYATGKRARGIMLTLYCLMSQRRREQIRQAITSRRAIKIPTIKLGSFSAIS